MHITNPLLSNFSHSVNSLMSNPIIAFQIYVIDSADRKRFEETGQVIEFSLLLNFGPESF